jgi:hypothetical protein
MRFYTINIFIAIALFVFVGTTSCKKKKEYVYEITPVTAKKESRNKNSIKTPNEFISLAYSDLFGVSIASKKLLLLNEGYTLFGDKKYVESIIIRNLLNDPQLQLISTQNMRANPKDFVTKAYKTLFAREVTEYELQYLTNYINTTPTLTSKLFYHSLLSSNEYRYY